MNLTSMEQWQTWHRESYTMLPYILKYPLDTDRLLSWDTFWQAAGPDAFVLESGKEGRYTFFGHSPVSVIRGKGEEAVITAYNQADKKTVTGRPLDVLKAWMEPYRSPKVPSAPKFSGGCVGFLGYDVVRSIEKLPAIADDDLQIPDLIMMRVDRLWIIDHEEHSLYCSFLTHIPEQSPAWDELNRKYQEAVSQADLMKEEWDRIAAVNCSDRFLRQRDTFLTAMSEDRFQQDPVGMEDIVPAFDKNDFMQAVDAIRRYIGQGDVFQVNLSLRQSRKLRSKPEYIYEWLRVLNPSPYMAYLRFPDVELVSASPELLVQVEDGRVRTRPIAGTRKRGSTSSEDKRLAEELIQSEKERAEHIMLVDLERNDLGKVSRYGTVNVTELMAVEYYSHVMHIVSEVVGELAEDKDAYDVIAAAFPGGTITGAPKIRTMEIIEELEPVRRGPYTGSIGWIDYNGNMELNIVIRTMAVRGGVGYIQAGAGIVIDSIPEREYKESINKARALWKAMEYSERYPLEH